MIDLGGVEFVERHYLGYDGAAVFARCVFVLNGLVDGGFLLRGAVKSDGTVLRPYVRPLPVERTAVVTNEKGVDKRIERDYGWVIVNLKRFGVAGLAAAYLLVSWVFEVTTGIARYDFAHPAQGFKLSFGTPETAPRQRSNGFARFQFGQFSRAGIFDIGSRTGRTRLAVTKQNGTKQGQTDSERKMIYFHTPITPNLPRRLRIPPIPTFAKLLTDSLTDMTTLGLELSTDPRWVDIARMNIDKILIDHAWCEQKAASSCISLIVMYTDKQKLVETLTPVVAEEWEHFQRVLTELQKRNIRLGRQRKDEYVNQLRSRVRRSIADQNEQMMDNLLINALIEARSCERFKLLAEHIADDDLKTFYRELVIAEAGHYRNFIDLAETYLPANRVRARWKEVLAIEADIMTTLTVRGDRMH